MRFLLLFFLSTATFCLQAFDATIPVLHLPDYFDEAKKEDFLEKLEDAAVHVGFFALTGAGVDSQLLDEVYEEISTYFSTDMQEKMQLKTPDGQRGYVPGESAKEEQRIDFKEFFHVGRELSQEDFKNLGFPKNVWPEKSPSFEKAMKTLYLEMDQCKRVIGDAFSEILQLEKNTINQMTEQGDCLMRAIHYPKNPPKSAIWAGAHTDINLFTILPRSTARGLQVFNNQGEWIDVIVPDGAFVINCGDMLENLTNGYFKSSIHRVIDPGNHEDRYSVVFFVHPKSFDRLDPLPFFIEKTGGERKYANITRLELLAERLIDLGLASQELMEFFVESGAIDRLKEVERFSPKAEEALKKAGFLF